MSIRIALTQGDPAGIGPELIEKAMSHFKNHRDIQLEPITMVRDVPIGRPSKRSGEVALKSIRTAVQKVLAGEADAIVTAPISKTALRLANSDETDHTTLLKTLTGASHTRMAFYSETLKVILATVHVPLSNVPTLITEKCIQQTIYHAQTFCHWCGIDNPKIALAGLNPHAGEDGLMGDEEKKLKKIAQTMREEGVNLSDPLPPDTVFRQAHFGQFDIVVALYHDQGLIPVKLIAFETAVNVTVGLPFIRTSPDHGTAYDIAGQNRANPSSFISAINCAHTLAKRYV